MSDKKPVHQSFRDFGRRPTTPQDVIDKIAKLVREDLEAKFQDEFVFDPIIVNPELDHYGDEFLHIYIIFDGDQRKLDPKWTGRLEGRLLDQFPEGALTHTPGHSFIQKSEWKEIHGEQIPF